VRLHIEAFAEGGGVPEVLVREAAVIRATFGTGSVTALNRRYRVLARYYASM
jgi:hypothetical protein